MDWPKCHFGETKKKKIIDESFVKVIDIYHTVSVVCLLLDLCLWILYLLKLSPAIRAAVSHFVVKSFPYSFNVADTTLRYTLQPYYGLLRSCLDEALANFVSEMFSLPIFYSMENFAPKAQIRDFFSKWVVSFSMTVWVVFWTVYVVFSHMRG